MKLVALGLLALVVLASAKPADKAKKILSRQKRQDESDFGSFDFGSIDMGSFDIGSFDPTDLAGAGDMMQSFANSMLDQGGLGSFDANQLDEIDGDAIFSQMGSEFSNMVSQMSSNIPDPLSDPTGFASYAAMMGGRFDGMGDVGDAIMGNMFESKLTTSLSNIGLTNFAGGEEVDAGMLMEQMSAGAWSMMSTMSQNADMFSVNTMSSDDFVTVMDVAGEMDPTLLQGFLDMKTNSSALTPEMMMQIPPELFGSLDPGVLGMVAANFSSEQVMVMCAGMEYVPSDTAMDLMQHVDCSSYYMNHVTDMDPETEMAMLEAKAANTPMDQWSDADWNQMANFAGGFSEDDFDYMSDAAVLANIGAFANADMGESEMFSFMDNVEEAFGGDFATIDADSFSNMGNMLGYMELEDFDKIPALTKLAALDNFIGLELDDEFAAIMYEEVMGLLPPPDQWSSSEFGKCIDFIKYDEAAMDSIPIEAMIGSLTHMGSFDMDPTESVTITDRLMEDAIYGNPANWNSSMLKDAGSLFAGFTPAFIDGMDGNDLYAAVSNMNDSIRDRMQLPREVARSMIEKVVSVLGNTPITPKLIGPVVKSLTSSEIAGLPKMQMNETIPVFSRAYDDMDQSSRRAVVEMAAASPGGLAVMFDKLGPFFMDLTFAEIDSLPYDQVNPKSPPADAINLIIKPAQARRGWQNFVTRVGKPSKAAGNWTMKMWKFMGPLICGIPCSEINKIPISSKFISILNLFVRQEKSSKGCLNDGQMTCMAKRVRQFFFKNNSAELDYTRVTKPNIQKSAYYMASMNLTDLNRLNTSVCQVLLNNVGKFELNMVPRSSLIKLKNYLMNCTGKAQSGEKITLEELRSVGDLQCGMELSDVNNFETKVYMNNIGKMLSRCPFLPVDVVDGLTDKMLEAMSVNVNDFNISESKLMQMGGGIFNLNETMLNKIPQTTMTKSLGRIKKVADKVADKEKKRAENGLSSDTSDADTATKEARKTLFYNKASESIVAQREAASGRKKRAASSYSSLTCGDLKKMGAGVTSLTVAQLNIDDATYSSCYGTLGAITGWSTDQKSQLATTAKRVWGTVSTWTSSKLLQVGTIAQGLSDSDLSAITYTNDIVSSLGKYSGWTSTQLSSIYSKWYGALSSTMTSTDLQSLGDIACGATTSQISAIAGATYQAAAGQIGSLLCNSEAQLQAWAGVAKTSAAFGAVSTWDASTIATVGTVIGGLSAADISSLSSTQIEAISTTTISSMPTSAFSGFTSSQLGYMTTTQVRGISSEQASSLSADAQGTLTSNENFVTATNTNSAGTISVSMAVLLAVTVRALFL